MRKNNDILLKNGICYPIVLGDNHNHLTCLYFPFELNRRVIKSRFPCNDEIFGEHKRRVLENFLNKIQGHENVVISGEFFSGFRAQEVELLSNDVGRWGVSRCYSNIVFSKS